MRNQFFEYPILNSPYEHAFKHLELDENGQPTQKIIERRRRADFITFIPKPQKHKRPEGQTNFVFDPTCVRKGTKVWVYNNTPEQVPSTTSGRDREGCSDAKDESLWLSLQESFTRSSMQEECSLESSQMEDFPRLPLGLQEEDPPRSPRRRGEEEAQYSLKLVEKIRQGDFVLAHDGKPHRVVRLIKNMYDGKIFGLRHDKCDQALWLTADHNVLVRRRPRSLGGNLDWSGVVAPNFEYARQMRKNMTPPEKIVWEMVRGNKMGVKFRRQHPLASYIPDFYSHEVNLVVEVDGESYHGSIKAKRHDAIRDALIEKRLIRVIRFSAKEVFNNADWVRAQIKNACDEFYNPKNAEWIEAGDLRVNDVVFAVEPLPKPLPVDGEGHREGSLTSEKGEKRENNLATLSIPLIPARITEIQEQITEETVYDLEVEDAHSFITEGCAVHNCGS